MKLACLLVAGFLAAAATGANAQSKAAEPSCTNGPYRLKLPKSYKGLRTMGHLRRERVVKSEGSVVQRELRFNGLEIVVLTTADKPNHYVVSRAVVSTANWRIAGPLRVGTSAKIALKGLQSKERPSDGELEFNGDKDSIRVTLSRGRILDFEYTCVSVEEKT
jgi:hypothetical protein